jgi:hypothetical protein
MLDVLREVRIAFGPGVRLALLWDNCRIHRANIVTEYARSEEIQIELVNNV